MAVESGSPKRVVIVGAGFGGLEAAKELAEAAVEVEVTLVDRYNFHTFLALLYQVATAGLNAADVAYPVRGIFRRQENVDFRQGTVIGVDWDTKRVRIVGAEASGDGLPFDYLIVAAGSVTNTFGVRGTEHAFPLYTLADAVRLRNHVLSRFESANNDPALIDQGALTLVVVGGGPTGVEVAGALSELVRVVFRRDFHHLPIDRTRIILLEMAPALLPPFQHRSQRHAEEALTRLGVEVRLGDALERMTPSTVRLKSGDEIATQTVVWAAGVKASPLAAALDVKTGPGGRIVVDPELRIPDHPEAFAVGDIAEILVAVQPARTFPYGRWWSRRRFSEPEPLPQLAQVAMQSGRHAARQIVRRIEGRPAEPFRYVNKGIMATIGRNAAVAELPSGVRLKGRPGWLAWLGLHLVYLIGARNRASVLLNWAWNYLTYDRGPRLIFEPRPLEDEPSDRRPPPP
ncbi:MAG: NAD(P)/FAD-dependent oxidoreductase [Acidimicrobiales bacterium]